MRKLAPMFIATSILALAAGTALANTGDVDKNGQPTVSANTNKQPLSYSDKSSTAKGTNAKMDDNKSATASSDTALNNDTKSYVTGEDKKEMRDETKDQAAAGTTTEHEGVKAKAKRAKDKVAAKMHKHKHATTAAREDTTSGMPTAKPSPSSDSTPASATKGEVANSMTGKSAGQ